MSVRYEVIGSRATLTLDDPERHNPMSVDVMAELSDLTTRALEDESVKVIVYTGEGDSSFSAGGDLSGSFADDAIGLQRERSVFADLLRKMLGGGKPTVARVNGHALAGGFGLAVACDITICVDDAKLGTTEVRVGLWPMMISAVLSRSMPRKAALELMLTGRTISPDEALRLGAVSRVVPRAELDVAVDEVCEKLESKSSAVLMIGKDSFNAQAEMNFDDALDRLAGGLTEVALTEDATEGISAFLDKRPAEWTER